MQVDARSVLLCILHRRTRTDPTHLGNQPLALIGIFCLRKPATQVAKLALTPLATAQLPYAGCCHVCSLPLSLVYLLDLSSFRSHKNSRSHAPGISSEPDAPDGTSSILSSPHVCGRDPAPSCAAPCACGRSSWCVDRARAGRDDGVSPDSSLSPSGVRCFGSPGAAGRPRRGSFYQ